MQVDFTINELSFSIWEYENSILLCAVDREEDCFARETYPTSVTALEIMKKIQEIYSCYRIEVARRIDEDFEEQIYYSSDIPY